MPIDLIMPKLGLTMEEGTVVRWLAAEGDAVTQGEPVLEVQTDKVVVEVEAPATGTLGALLVKEDQTVPVGALLAHIYAPGEAKAAAPRVTPLARRMAEQAGVDVSALASVAAGARITAADVRRQVAITPNAAGRVFSSPRARKRARELGVAWRELSGSGPRHRVVERDVLSAASVQPPMPAPAPPQLAAILQPEAVRWETPSPVQRITGERMAASFSAAPHFYLTAEVIASQLLDARERLLPIVERRTGVRLTVTDLLLRIAAVSLSHHARANAFWQAGRIGINAEVNIGLAVAAASDTGLVVPVLRGADHKPLSQIAAERADLVERARAGTLRPGDLAGGTFTLTNLGMYRVDTFQAILNPPQSAILAVGRIAERAVVIGGQLAVRPTALLTLSCDHRVLDGATAAAFLGELAELCEEPMALLA
jgi:pyruvate dehydrogenase E2 component (dihydrolipoamide acetyltransferase)